MRFARTLLALLCVLAAHPATAQGGGDADAILALKNLQLLDKRLHDVGYRLATGNADFCADRVALSGLMLHDIRQYGDADTARMALGIDGAIAVNAVATASGARDGLLPGDDVTAIDGVELATLPIAPEAADEDEGYRRIASARALLADRLSRGPVRLTVLRGGVESEVALTGAPGCTTLFQVTPDEDRRARADGRVVSITSSLADYVMDDDELAAIAAHELAHNLLKHRERLDAMDVNRGFFGQFGKSAGRIKATEIEADRLSVWLMANAGYDPEAAIRFWTRYGREHGKGILSASTHYRWRKRVGLFEEEIAAMEAAVRSDGKYPPPLLAGTR